MRAWIGAACVLSAACSGHSPTAPAPVVPPVIVTPPAPTTYTIAGTVTATNGGQPLSGATIDLGGTTTTTDGSGRYTLTLALGLPSTLPLRVSGPGLLTHGGYVRGGASRSVDLDAIRLDGTFDPAFFRAFVHNGLESPGNLRPLAHWIAPPNVYLMTVDDQGHAIEARTLNVAAAALINTASMWTGGRFGLGSIEQGPSSATYDQQLAGWVTVQWRSETSGPYCGLADDIGYDQSSIQLFYKKPNCGCPGTQIRARTVRHELGHILGYWHTADPKDVMYASGPGCDLEPSARERYHAAILYSRPTGNRDPDDDPSSNAAILARPHGIP